ncbi:MAG: hypothetical protein MUF08_05170 [Burkholderiaceae bacterium]|jgi:hypothetical protein|nr:hypothetical protein [Burkholderiaceae bacterium]
MKVTDSRAPRLSVLTNLSIVISVVISIYTSLISDSHDNAEKIFTRFLAIAIAVGVTILYWRETLSGPLRAAEPKTVRQSLSTARDAIVTHIPFFAPFAIPDRAIDGVLKNISPAERDAPLTPSAGLRILVSTRPVSTAIVMGAMVLVAATPIIDSPTSLIGSLGDNWIIKGFLIGIHAVATIYYLSLVVFKGAIRNK